MAFEPEALGGLKGRERVATVVVGAIFGLLLLRLLTLQVLQGGRYRELSEENRIRVEVLTAPRGEIRDRNGLLLADNIPSFTVTIDPFDNAYVGDPAALDSTVSRLSAILDFDSAALIARVKKEKSQSFLPIRLKRNIELKQVAYISEHRELLPGVEVESEPLRRYPFGQLASHLLGYVGEISDKELEEPRFSAYIRGDLVGRMGVERQYERYLRGVDGKRFVEVNALGRKAELLGDKRPILPKRGIDLKLTIDFDLQRVAENAFQPGARGALVAIDPRNGDVLALASKPNYDPNEFSNGITQTRWNELSSGGNYPLFNRAIQAAYPPGSTLKPLTALAGLTLHAISPGTVFAEACTGSFRLGSRLFGCWDHNGHGYMSLRQAVAHSCDVYFYQLGLRLGVERMGAFMKQLGLSERTGIDLPQERRGLFPDVAWYDKHYGAGHWSRGLALNIAIGQGETSLTPVKLAQLTAMIANGGMIWTPRVLESVSRAGVVAAEPDAPGDSLGRRVGLSSRDLATVRDAMVAVVQENGATGYAARVQDVMVGGKTGTAQVTHGQDHALFVCFAPASAPTIVIAVLVENAGHGSTAAAPVAQKVLQAYFHPASAESLATTAAVRVAAPRATAPPDTGLVGD